MLRNWTLRTRLIALVVALLAATSVVIGVVTAVVVRSSVTDQFDSQLKASVQQVSHSGFSGTASGSRQLYLPAGSVVAAFADTGDKAGLYCPAQDAACANPLNQADLGALGEVSADGTAHVVPVSGYGSYRVVAMRGYSTAGPATWFVGIPQSALSRRIAASLATIAVVIVLAILLAALLGAFIIGRALRPLRRVAGVASSVAALPLERGDVNLPQRVPERDTNPHTEVGQVGAALNSLLDSVGSALAVRQASEEKVRAFVADASHELRTPLASIRGYAELTRRFGGELTDDVQHNIDRIESESKRMTALVEDLLLLARLDSQPELAVEDVDLSRLLVDVVGDAHAAGRDHRWDLELPDEPVIVRGDDARLHQVFTNLLANARVHTPPDTRVTVQLRQPTGDTVTVLVRDSGPGIPAELLPRLFGRFVRGDSSRNRTTGSTGLGLSIVSAVVQAQGGTVDVTSQPGDTTFRVTLPRAEHDGRADPADPAARQTAEVATSASA